MFQLVSDDLIALNVLNRHAFCTPFLVSPQCQVSLTAKFVSVSGVLSNEQMGMSSYGHSQIDTYKQTLKQFHCPSCPAKFVEKFQLSSHMSQNHGDKMPFHCHLCGKGYLSSRGLSHHMGLHKGKQFECPVCGRKMNRKDHMRTHIRHVHKSDQCFTCMQVFPLEEYHLHVSSCHGMS